MYDSSGSTMFEITSTPSDQMLAHSEDERVFGWDPTPGIVSVWANREGRAIVWRREGEHITCTAERFRPWLFATSLADLAHLGSSLHPSTVPGADTAAVSYRELDSPADAYRYLLS